MSATVSCDFASVMYQWVPTLGFSRWLSSNKTTMSPELVQQNSKVYPGLAISYPGIKVLPTRGVLPIGKPLTQTCFYETFMQPYNWRYALTLIFWKTVSPPKLDCAFSVYRTAEQPDFSTAEIATLTALHVEIERARLRVAELEEQRAAFRSLQHFLRDLPVPAMLLNWQLEVLYNNRDVLNYCDLWQNGARGRLMKRALSVPIEVLDACRKMKAEWLKELARLGSKKVVRKRVMNCQRTVTLCATISMLQLEPVILADPNFLIVFDGKPAGAAGVPSSLIRRIEKFANLTGREREVASFITEGISNQEIADRLGRSVGTVKAELHSVFKKLSVTTRTQLLLCITGAALTC